MRLMSTQHFCLSNIRTLRCRLLVTYRKNNKFNVNSGFHCNANHIEKAAIDTNDTFAALPFSLFNSIDYKTTSTILGRVFSAKLAKETGSIVNPIEKGHPDIIPKEGKDASEAELRNYPEGIEIKVTAGNVEKGSPLKRGSTRINYIRGITWQAHHREVEALLGLIWDFSNNENTNPVITGAFYSDLLNVNDWGTISGTTGRNTKVTGMRVSGKNKMGNGWILIINNPKYIECYQKILNFTI